jgi:hypothetical protein
MLADVTAPERQAFHNTVRAFPGAARSAARKAREAYKRAWRDARAADVANAKAFNRECWDAYWRRCQAEDAAKKARARDIARRNDAKRRTRSKALAAPRSSARL